jgi:hypothetical protein
LFFCFPSLFLLSHFFSLHRNLRVGCVPRWLSSELFLLSLLSEFSPPFFLYTLSPSSVFLTFFLPFSTSFIHYPLSTYIYK